jgi:large subunit ribosomal protein L25
MSEEFTVIAKSRQLVGQGASRRLRRQENFVPAIVYGADKPPMNIAIDHNKVRKSLENEAFYSHILKLDIEGKSEDVVLKALQRHPSKRIIMHMDFLRIKAGTAITMHVPLHFTNQETAPGVKAGGVVTHMVTDLEVSCLPKDLPEFIKVDLGQLEMDQVFHLSEIHPPKGVTFTLYSPEDEGEGPALANIHAPRAMIEEETAEEAKEEATEGEETPAESTDADKGSEGKA